MVKRGVIAWTLTLTLTAAVSANAQTSSPGTSDSDKPATTTFLGDTGLWFVPAAEVLPHGQWSASVYRRGTNYVQGFTNIGDFAGTFAIGIKARAEIFGSFLFDTRVERDLRPVFSTNPETGGIVDRYPRANSPWSGDNVGDFYLGAKVNLLSELTDRPVAFALRGVIKLPTADEDAGAGTGATDFLVDFIVSKDAARKVDLSGYAGYEFRGQPDGIDSPGGAFRWGVGAGFPSRGPLRGIVELNGFLPSQDTTTITPGSIVGVDGSIAPTISDTEAHTRATFGLNWQHASGFFLGGGVSLNVPTESRSSFAPDDPPGDFIDWQFRLGFHPGRRTPVVPAPAPVAVAAPAPAPAPKPAPPAPPAPPPPPNRNPQFTVNATCNPCIVDVGQTSQLTATATDPDGDPVTYQWTVPQGTLSAAAAQNTVWTAPNATGNVTATVTARDNRGGSATSTVGLQVVRRTTIVFDDVHFDFDRFNLRPDALKILDDAVTKLMASPDIRVTIEGHTDSTGTSEYNLALGERRATAVRDYLANRGIVNTRLRTVSYGEERPIADNGSVEGRAMNRRAHLVIILEQP